MVKTIEGKMVNPDGSQGQKVALFDVWADQVPRMKKDDPFRVIREVPDQMKDGTIDVVEGLMMLYRVGTTVADAAFYESHGLPNVPDMNYVTVKEIAGDLLPPGAGREDSSLKGFRYQGGIYMYAYPFLDAIKRYSSHIEQTAIERTGDPSFFRADVKISEVISALRGE